MTDRFQQFYLCFYCVLNKVINTSKNYPRAYHSQRKSSSEGIVSGFKNVLSVQFTQLKYRVIVQPVKLGSCEYTCVSTRSLTTKHIPNAS